jgi:hypothetical protein
MFLLYGYIVTDSDDVFSLRSVAERAGFEIIGATPTDAGWAKGHLFTVGQSAGELSDSAAQERGKRLFAAVSAHGMVAYVGMMRVNDQELAETRLRIAA